MELALRIKTFFLSFFTRNFNNINLHNLEKFIQIKKIWFNINLDSVKGDYIEFGIFKGKSLYHSIKVAQKLKLYNDITFWGLDSFQGFPVENHDFYISENFKTSKKTVENFFLKYKNIKIIEGFFNQSLSTEQLQNIQNISFAFVDCDIYESSEEVFQYLNKRISKGGFIMIDDFTSIDKNGNYIAKSFFDNFSNRDFILFDIYSNGQTYRIMN
tara:strand:- start:314 stop:955 length:642 start_codon:yes stop_codon:yes gene_type:complete